MTSACNKIEKKIMITLGATTFTLETMTTTLTKPTPCFITSGDVSQCRRKRGLEEKPQIVEFEDLDIVPSVIVG